MYLVLGNEVSDVKAFICSQKFLSQRLHSLITTQLRGFVSLLGLVLSSSSDRTGKGWAVRYDRSTMLLLQLKWQMSRQCICPLGTRGAKGE